MTGLLMRLRRLLSDGYYSLVAADHGMSQGIVRGIESLGDVESLGRAAAKAGMRGIVVNYGMARHLRWDTADDALHNLSLVIQTYGRPVKSVNGGTRQPLCSIEDAVSAGAECVSFQLELGQPLADANLRELGELASSARVLGIPSLLMVGRVDTHGVGGFLDMMRAVAELPVDLLKVDPGGVLRELPGGCLATFPLPCLYAGGPLTSSLATNLRHAATAGFSGVCLGRNFFQAGDPCAVAREIRGAFAPEAGDTSDVRARSLQ